MGVLPPRNPVDDYDELLIRIEGTGHRRTVLMRTGPDPNEVQGEFRGFVSSSEVTAALAGVSRAAQAYAMRGKPQDTLDPLREIGQKLFVSLFEGERGSLYRHALAMADSRGRGLRLALAADDAELAALPWEFLHDGQSFVNLSARTPVVRLRLPDVAQPPRELLPPATRLQMLAVIADVTDVNAGNVEPFRKYLEQLPATSSQLELTVLHGATPDRLYEALGKDHYHVLQFVGSGVDLAYGEQALLMMDGQGQPAPVRFSDLKMMLMGVDQPELRLVHLAACKSELLARALNELFPCTVGIRELITVRAAVAFTAGLLESILAGQSLVTAVSRGRQRVDVDYPGSREWGLPVLYLDTSAVNSRLLARAPAAWETLGPVATSKRAAEPAPAGAGRGKEWQKLQSLLSIRRKNLVVLQQRASVLGPGTTPQEIQAQIVQTSDEIAQLERQLEQMS
jgi:hypothetical protein